MKCLACCAVNALTARYCNACGARLEQTCVGDRGLALKADLAERCAAAEQALLEAHERHRNLTKMSSDYYWETDARHGITRADLFKTRNFDFRGSNEGRRRWEFPDAVSPDKAGWEAHRAVLDAHMPFRNFEFSHRSTDGVRRYFSINGEPVFDASGAFTGYRGLGMDITDRKQSENELIYSKKAAEEANLAKSRFLASASHDLRQPIQAINLFSMALTNTALSEEQKQISDYLALSAKSLATILDALLDISKLDAGQVKTAYELIDTKDLIRKVVAEVALTASEKRLRLRVFSRREELMSFADPKLLRSLLGNLVDNAIKYTERGGVLVGIRRRGRQILIQVWDTGIAIAPEHIENIFEEYFQVGNPERDRTKGLGLGLAIAKRIAGLLETEIVCRSRLGKGSVFEFSLPLADESQEQLAGRIQQGNISNDANASIGGRRIVVIEDDWTVAVAVKLSLESQGMSVTVYQNAEDALANPGIAEADFYISDLRLPGLNGREFLDALQARSQKRINGVIMTGDTSPERVEPAKSSSWRVMLKPVDLPSLLSAISTQGAVH